MSIVRLTRNLKTLKKEKNMGWLVAVLLLVVIILIHEAGHLIAAKMVGAQVRIFSIGFGRRLAGIRYGGTDYRLSLWPLGGYVSMNQRIFDAMPVWRRAVVVSAGVAGNAVFALLIMWAVFFTGVPGSAPVIGEVLDGSPAAVAGIEPGDRVLGINGAPARTWEDFALGVRGSQGNPVDLLISRSGAELALRAYPEQRVMQNAIGERVEVWVLGVASSGESIIVSYSATASLKLSAAYNYDIMKLNALGLRALVTGQLKAEESLAGPVGIVSVSNQVYQLGWIQLAMWAALLSTVIGMMNILPLPVLDGGQLVWLAVEKVSGAKPRPALISIANAISIILLLVLLFFATRADMARFW